MTILDLIEKKKHSKVLSRDEWEFLVKGYVRGQLPDYQVSALLMAVWFAGISAEESAWLTMAMAASGDQIDLSELGPRVVDKHSTGGVADTTTLIAAPAAAACGVRVAKMSGRGLGHTGGTIDKLESIPGFRTELAPDDFFRQVKRLSLAVISQGKDLVPADKLLYALRDVTGTVDCLGLIASSIMSKKLASGAPAIVLDVKTGNGAFMKNIEDSRALASLMIDIGVKSGRRMAALISDMSQPLGCAIGNALEVREAVEILSGASKGDLYEVSVQLAAQMVCLSDTGRDFEQARENVEAAISGGRALSTLAAMIEAQGGNPSVCSNPSLLPTASRKTVWKASKSGFIEAFDTEGLGRACQALGAGRQTKTDVIDPAVGMWMRARIGQRVEAGDALADIHYNDELKLKACLEKLASAVVIGAESPGKPVLIHNRMSGEA
jgi:pyrimidine-nucleoside phosphorylase